MMLRRLAWAFCVTFLSTAPPAAPAAEKLEYIAVMSRHGIRSPLWTQAEQNSYSAQPWPIWTVPTGYLTSHGFTVMQYMGDYYREYLTANNLLPESGCSAADRFYFWSDTDERDIETGRALASRMFRDCTVPVHRGPAGKTDPLFSPVKAGIGRTDPEAAAKAISEAIGGPPEILLTRYEKQIAELQKVLLGCEPGKTCSPQQIAGRKLLVGQPAGVQPARGLLADVTGPFKAAYEMADMFLLEYTEGLKPQDVGWGRVNKSNLMDFMQIYQAYVDLTLRTPYLARASGSNLMSHILKSMQQAAQTAPVAGSLGKPGDIGLVFLGHDSNESNLSGVLGTSWQADGYQPNSRPPGSALVFEMWKDTGTGKYSVHTWFVTQTLDQMRNSVPLSLKTPPVRVPITVKGCGGPVCDWDKFQTAVAAGIDPAFVSNEPLAEGK